MTQNAFFYDFHFKLGSIKIKIVLFSVFVETVVSCCQIESRRDLDDP